MKEKDNELIEELIYNFRSLKRMKFNKPKVCDKLTHNERMILFVIYENIKNDKISLALIRKNLKLAPSTITPIITSLENKGLIERKIDKNDRRNIYLRITQIGLEYTNKVQIEIKEDLTKYIEYIGKEDTKKLIRLITKTIEFFDRKEE